MNSDDGDSDNEINNVDDYDVCNRHKKTIRMVEFFSGIGGMRLAVTNALKQQQRQEQDSMSLELCQAYDISLYANETYKHNFNGDVAKTKLVEQLTVKQLDEMNANLWTMSPPCQPFTRTRGSKQLDLEDKRCNGLKSLMLEKLPKLSIKPKWIVLENVKGFATSHMLEVVKQSLHNCGYTYQQYLVSPIHFGIPNHRQRYYLLCERSNRFHAEEETICTTIPSSLPPPLHRRKISEYLTTSHNDNLINDNTHEESNSYMIPKPVLEKPWAKHLSIVTCHDDETYCFTAGYGRIYHKSTGSFFLVTQEQEQQEDVASTSASTITSKDLDRTDMTQYYGSLRRFTPRELLTLFGFIDKTMPSTKAPTSTTARNSAPQQPEQEFHFPPTINLEHQYKLIGNSINVTVVTELLKELLSSSDVVEREEQINHQQQMLEQLPSLWSAPLNSTSLQCQTVREERSSPQPQPEQQSTITVGGMKGHQVESISGLLLHVYNAYRWKMIPNCTGRYTCRDHNTTSLSPLQLLHRTGITTVIEQQQEVNNNAYLKKQDEKMFEIAVSATLHNKRISLQTTGSKGYGDSRTVELGADGWNDNICQRRTTGSSCEATGKTARSEK